MGYKLREVGKDQAELIVEIVNQHELTIDPESTPMGVEEAQELIDGFFDNAHCYFLIDHESDEALGFYSVNPDANRKKLFTDVYERPGKGLIKDVIAESLKKAAEVHPDYEHLFGVNTKDQVMREALESFAHEALA